MADQELGDKVIVITGASSGFGRGAALKFAGQGARLVLVARREDALDELAGECQALGGPAIAVGADVGVEADVSRVVQAALAQFGRIDVWINNAGVGVLGIFEEIPLEDHTKVIQTNLLGTMHGSYHAIRQFKLQGSGTLINVSSVLGEIPAPYYSSYAASKHGVIGLSVSIRQELEELKFEDVHVCLILPTSMDTPFFEHAGNYTGHTVEPIPPVYDPEKVIDTMVRLASHPEDKVAVGSAGKVFSFSHHLIPGLTEKMLAVQTHRTIQKADSAADTTGAVHHPVEAGTRVEGGKRE